MSKLNLGCGPDYRDGWVNVDSGNCKSDVKHDIEQIPWPFDDNSVENIEMQHILEHIHRINFIHVVREMYRVCKNGAFIHIISPYAGSDNFFTDPTHVMPLTARTFDYFDKRKPLGELGAIYGWGDINFEVSGVSIPNHPNGPDVEYNIFVKKD